GPAFSVYNALMCTTLYPAPDWAAIRTVLLDMDGTLLDRAFDDHFYLEALPAHYAAANRMSVEAARERLVALYHAVEGELDWTDVDYWAKSEVILGFVPAATLYVDDDEAALLSAQTHGIRHLYHRARSRSTSPTQVSAKYPSIENFHALMK